MFAVIQLASTNNKSENLSNVTKLITEAANKGAKVFFVFFQNYFVRWFLFQNQLIS